jgi:glucose/arabinose dehydrogenase
MCSVFNACRLPLWRLTRIIISTQRLWAVVSTWIFIAALGSRAFGAVDWPVLGFTQVVTNGFSSPTCIAAAGDGSQRLFVAENWGRIWIIQGNSVLAQPFLDITNRVCNSNGNPILPTREGLTSVAFPPAYSNNPHFYVDYNRITDHATVISRFFLTTNANVADTNSEQIIMVIPETANYNVGGHIAFGPDGYLYIGTGDGGPEGDTQNHAQNPASLLGKILRIDVESGSSPYAVPPSNPFAGNTNYAQEIWALGLQDPASFSFDPLTGDLYIGDVENPYEQYQEIDFQPAGSPGGLNYGWRITQGTSNNVVPPGFTNFASLTLPVAWYMPLTYPGMGDCIDAAISGYVYRGPNEPRLNGLYFYGDLDEGWIWGLTRAGTNWVTQPLLDPPDTGTNFWISAFGQDDQGQLYLADYWHGHIYQIGDTQQAWTPVFSPASGTINSNTVIITCLTTNAEIHYTTNGVGPTLSDPMVVSGGTIPVTSGFTNKAQAFRSDLTPSAVASAILTCKVGTPVFSPPSGSVTNNTRISLSTPTPGAAIYYTINNSTPTTNSPRYSGPFLFSGSLTLKALGAAVGYANSAVATATYSEAQAATPVFSPASGPITNGTSISISCSTPGSKVYYTADGTTPTTNSAIYSAPLAITQDTTLSALAAAPNDLTSGARSVTYTLAQVPTPTFSPPQGPITNGAAISISCSMPGSTIYYTVDGTAPGTNSPVYTGPLALSGPVILNACAYIAQRQPSVIASNFFSFFDMQPLVVSTLAGAATSGFTNGPASLARFNCPQAICSDWRGNLLVADTSNNVIRKIDPTGQVSTFAGSGGEFSGPTGVYADGFGNVYVADSGNCNRICKIDPNGVITTFAYVTPSAPGTCNYASALWQLRMGPNFALLAGYWASVYQVFPDGSVNQLAGTGANGPGGWEFVVGACNDQHADVYSATGGNLWKTVLNISTTLFAGGNSAFSDGPRLLAGFNNLQDVVIDSSNNIYLSDTTWIRRLAPDGWVSTLAGTGVAGYKDGLGSVAQFNNAAGMCIDTQGNIYVADAGNNCIRMLQPSLSPVSVKLGPATLLSGGGIQVPMIGVEGQTYVIQASTDLVNL